MWFKLYQDMTALQLTANEVVWQRGMLMWQQAVSGTLRGDASPAPRFTQEMTAMVTEKFAIIPEMALAVWTQQLQQIGRFKHALTAEDYLKNWAALHSATLIPLRKRARANQQRLRRKK